MRILTVFGTRPEMIRLSLIMKVLDQHCEHVTVNAGENFDPAFGDIFTRELEIRTPDVQLDIGSGNFADQAAQILKGVDKVLEEHKPDKVLILGDSNGALSAIVAARRNIPVFRMEAGNRSFEDRAPEEVNRRMIDHASTFLLPYTERSKENLIAEGISRKRIYVTGNPINEVLNNFDSRIEKSEVLGELKVRAFEYFLVRVKHAENVDKPGRLASIFKGLSGVAERFGKPILISCYPQTRDKLKSSGITFGDKVTFIDPRSFFDFVKLEKNALAVITDSGSVQEECSIFGIPNVTLRNNTDRAETIECGSNILSRTDPDSIIRSVEIAIAQPSNWTPPWEYSVQNTSQIVTKIILGAN